MKFLPREWPRANEFDPRFSKAELEAARVVTYDDLLKTHEQALLAEYQDDVGP